MGEALGRKVYNSRGIKNFKQLVDETVKNHPRNIAYKYKKDAESKDVEYMQKTYEETKEDIKSFSTELLDLGLEGKNIAVIGNNRYEWCVTYLAVTTGNMIIVPLDKALPNNEIETLLIRSKVNSVVFDKKYLETITKLKQSGKSNLKELICMDDIEDEEVKTFKSLIQNGKKLIEEGNNKYEQIEIDEEKMSIMLFTSGTTNSPKAVMLSQKNICQNIADIACYIGILDTDILLSFLPIHHTFECTITFLYGFYSGATVAFCDGLKHIQKNLVEYGITVLVAVPLVLETMYKKIQKGIEEKGKTKLINTITKISNALLKCKIDIRKKVFKQILDQFGGKLRVVLYGAAPMNKDIIIGYSNLGVDLVQGYGLTETSPVVSAETDKEKKPGSVGLALPSLDVKISEADNEGIGEITVKGPSVMLGYYENEEETAKSLKDGWFYTGDYGYIDNNGFIFVTGRKKDVIVLKNGKNIYPQEIEFLINKILYVAESMVYPKEVDDKITIGAKIVYDEEHIKKLLGDKTEEEYKKIIWDEIKEVNKTLPLYKYVKEIKITKEPLAKTTTQKVKRFEEMKKLK